MMKHIVFWRYLGAFLHLVLSCNRRIASTTQCSTSWLMLPALALSLALASPHAEATTAVGAIPSIFSVNRTGAAVYRIPIKAPGGVAGMTPQIALTYNSQSSNGLIGIGWHLAGLSVITRCRNTIAQNGDTRGVMLDSGDRFCLNGNQLRLASGNYGGSGATYRTEIDHFARITSYTGGGAGASPASGPQWFKVQTTDGLTYDYGKTADAEILANGTSIVRVWALDRIADTAGNSIKFAYASSGSISDPRITSITYAGTGAAAAHTMAFSYASNRPDPIVAYQAGTLIEETNRLTGISINYQGNAIERYQLSYASTGVVSRLASIQACAGEQCFAPTTVAWQTNQPGYEHAANTGVSGQADAHTMDVNGDGRDDLVYVNNGTWHVKLGTDNGLRGAHDSGIDAENAQYAMPVNYNGDKYSDLLVPGANGDWIVDTGASDGLSQSRSIDTGIANSGFKDAETTDIDGDGLDDVVWTDASGHLRVLKNSPSGFDASSIATVYAGADVHLHDPNFAFWRMRAMLDARPDFNGDGIPDLMVYTKTNTGQIVWRLLVSTGQSYRQFASVSDGALSVVPIFADLNGDGLTDIVWPEHGSNGGQWHVFISQGTGLGANINTGISSDGFSYQSALAMDYNGDGKDDILVPKSGWNSSGQWWVLLSNGTNDLDSPANTGLAAPYSNYDARMADLNGDGLPGLVWREGNSGTSWHTAAHTGPYPHLATTITDGLGNTFQPQYAPISNPVVYTSQGIRKGLATYPRREFTAPLHVVSNYRANDGNGDAYTETYRYMGGVSQCDRARLSRLLRSGSYRQPQWLALRLAPATRCPFPIRAWRWAPLPRVG